MKQRGKTKELKEMRTTSGTSRKNVKCPNIRIIGVPEEGDKKKGHEKIFEEIIVLNVPNREGNSCPSPRNPESP